MHKESVPHLCRTFVTDPILPTAGSELFRLDQVGPGKPEGHWSSAAPPRTVRPCPDRWGATWGPQRECWTGGVEYSARLSVACAGLHLLGLMDPRNLHSMLFYQYLSFGLSLLLSSATEGLRIGEENEKHF